MSVRQRQKIQKMLRGKSAVLKSRKQGGTRGLSNPSESKDIANPLGEPNSQTLSACFEFSLPQVFSSGFDRGFGERQKERCEPAKKRMFF
jgi:hypothetical protein